jgi:ABC-type bacteriocin/lantibiotic exporter with double-glycine peptidase domain
MFNFKERIKKQINTYKNLGFDSAAKNKTRHILSMVLCAVSLILLIPAGIHLILDSLIHIISVGGSIVFYTLAEHIRN